MSTELDPLEALRAELAKVEVSPDFAKRVLTTIEWSPVSLDPGTTLENELSAVTVSPAFAVRVREAIEEQSARRSWFPLNWRWVVPVAAVVIAAIAFMSAGSKPSSGAGVATIATNEPRQVPAPAIEQQPAPVPAAPVSVAARETARPTVAEVAADVIASEPALEVITNQPAILRRLWAQVSAAPTVVDAAASLPVGVQEISIEPVEVNPVVVKWLVEPPAPSGVLPSIRRVSADAERSAK